MTRSAWPMPNGELTAWRDSPSRDTTSAKANSSARRNICLSSRYLPIRPRRLAFAYDSVLTPVDTLARRREAFAANSGYDDSFCLFGNYSDDEKRHAGGMA